MKSSYKSYREEVGRHKSTSEPTFKIEIILLQDAIENANDKLKRIHATHSSEIKMIRDEYSLLQTRTDSVLVKK